MDIDENVLYRELGQRLKAARGKLKWTQAQLAEKSGVSRASIAVIEVGKQNSPLHVVYRLCRALDIEVTAVLPSNSEVTAYSPRSTMEYLPMTAGFVEESQRILERGIPYGDQR
ncbi:MAG: helix-turn-helix transcriptional regulator [Chloroflexi bacterium]|nr:helix-turn-helix transcriptional regulator [Chloroflexota bacterium]